MVQAEIWFTNLGEWHGQLRETDTGEPVGEEWIADQRGALIGLMANWIPLTHLGFQDVGYPAY
jgi:hypothetical protein